MSDNVTKEFAIRLQKLIFESGKSIKQLATEIGIPSGSLSKYQNNAAEPGINSLCKIADYFDVSADYLLGITDQRTSNIDDKAIHETLGLSDKSIVKLKGYKKNLPSVLIPTLNALIEYEQDADDASLYSKYSNVTTMSAEERENLYQFHKRLSSANPKNNEQANNQSDYPDGPLILIDDYFNSVVDKKGRLSIEVEGNFIGSVDSQQIIDTVILDKIKEVLVSIRKKQIGRTVKPTIRYKKYPESIDEAIDNRLLDESNIEDIMEKIRHDVEKVFLEIKKGEVTITAKDPTMLASNSALFDDGSLEIASEIILAPEEEE